MVRTQRRHRRDEPFCNLDLEARVRRDHSLRVIRKVANEALPDLERDVLRLLAD